MPLNYDVVKNWRIDPIRQRYSERDTILYNLGVGAGVMESAADADLSLVWERELRTIPTMATTLGDPDLWLNDPKIGADWHHLVHGEHSMEWFTAIPPQGDVTSHFSVEEIFDKGPERGALVVTRRTIICNVTGTHLATVRQTVMLLKDGGCGGATNAPKPYRLPDREPDLQVNIGTRPEQALLYRLSGDRFQIHVDPEFARQAGQPGPILHGLCTYGMACRVIVDALCDGDGRKLRRLDARFSAPVIPGEKIDVLIWRTGNNEAGYRCHVDDRIVLNNGYVQFD